MFFSPYPNAVAFSGYSHYSLTDERGLWQGSFTSIGTSSLFYTGMPDGRENGGTDNRKLLLHMPRMATSTGKQGMFLSVFGDRMVIESREFVFDYEVQAQVLDCDTVKPFCTKRIFAENFFLADGRVEKTGRCVFALDELPKDVSFRFAVRPSECFGKTGVAIYSEKKRLEGKGV